MKTIITIIFSLSSLMVKSQCDVLNAITDTTEFEGVTIRYYQVDSTIQIQYDYKEFSNELGNNYSFPCDLTYRPGIPRPVWKNENFICFLSGCGTSCFSNYLAPLNDQFEAVYGGQFLIDTTNTIFMSLQLDTVTYEPYLELENFTNGQTQNEQFNRKDFPVAIPIEYLDYSSPHEKGFAYSDNILILYLKDDRKLKVKVKI
ncbi:MAG: hypothetical protein JJU02_17090 [Cryomorphaceae bacterium]|nr:hypothetical protein [Cryomorphaceae bacterium]